MNHTGHHLDPLARESRHHKHLAMLNAVLVYNHERFSPDRLNAATMQVPAGECRLVGRAGCEVVSWSE